MTTHDPAAPEPKSAEARGKGRSEETRERILIAAEELLRRHGPAKTKVMDVARQLNMSHANVYRHFDSKADIQDLVAARWLTAITEPLAEIARGGGPATERLYKWTEALISIKHALLLKDPELFATYCNAVYNSRGVIADHLGDLRAQLARIIEDGVAQGEFKVADVKAAGVTVHKALARYTHPYFVSRPASHREGARETLALLVGGLQAGVI
jgi:AcrR family transcriptional regulator